MAYRIHPLAELFPLTTGEEFIRLRDDIRKNGLLEPIVRLGGQILDGRNRLRACEELGKMPKFVEFEKLGLTVTPDQYVWSKNVARRHLTPDQLAAIAMKYRPQMVAEAQERQAETNRNAPRDEKGRIHPAVANSPPPDKGERKTRHKLASLADVSEYKIRQAETVEKKAPQLTQKVASGEMTLREAVETATGSNKKPGWSMEEAIGSFRRSVERLDKTCPGNFRNRVREAMFAVIIDVFGTGSLPDVVCDFSDPMKSFLERQQVKQ